MDLGSCDLDQLVTHIIREQSVYLLFDSIVPVLHNRRDLYAYQPVKTALCAKIRNDLGGGQIIEITFLFKRFLSEYKKPTPIFVDVIAEGRESKKIIFRKCISCIKLYGISSNRKFFYNPIFLNG